MGGREGGRRGRDGIKERGKTKYMYCTVVPLLVVPCTLRVDLSPSPLPFRLFSRALEKYEDCPERIGECFAQHVSNYM